MIVFTTFQHEDTLRLAYNNDVVRFYSNSAGIVPLYCDVTALGLNVRLYPAPGNRFFFNFKPFVTALLNTRNFEDVVVTDLNADDPESFIYESVGTFLRRNVTFKIRMSNNTDETQSFVMYWFAGVEQLGNHITFSRKGLYALSPFIKGTTNKHYIKYWQGYPFDISVYYFIDKTLRIKNLTNLMEAEFIGSEYIKRLFLSDGRTDETLDEVLPLVEGYNELKLMQNEEPNANEDKYITLEKVPYKCGVYFKWLNKYAGYSYWLFEDTYSIDRNSKQLGELDRDTFNREDTFSNAIQIGKESQDTIRVVAELLTAEERDIVEGIFDSPKIYMFTGQPFARNGVRDWVEVSLKTTNGRIKNAKEMMTNMALDFELPIRHTQTL